MSERSADDIRVGASFEDLLILEELGKGAFGTVFLAKDTVLERPIALKVIRPMTSTSQAPEILNEARLVASIRSPHVVTLYRVHGLAHGAWALEMERIDGASLRESMDIEGAATADRIRRVLVDVLNGLQAAHDQGVVHHDVKPANVLVDERGRAKLTDFGLGLRLGEASLLSHRQGAVRGTPLYMSPEAITGERGNPSSDVWSVGVIAYELLVGIRPFRGDTLPTLFSAIREGDPPALPSEAPDDLCRLIHACLRKDASERPVSAAKAADLVLVSKAQRRQPRIRTTQAATGIQESASRRSLVGRDDELRTVSSLLRDAMQDRGGTLLVTGDMGMGKSALAQEAARRGAAMGFRCITGHGSDCGGLIRSLQSQFDPPDPGSVDNREDPSPPNLDGLLERMLRSQPMMVVVEDIDTCDDDDLRFVLRLVQRTARTPLAVLLTSRTRDVRPVVSSSDQIVERIVVDRNVRHMQIAEIPDHLIKHLVRQRYPDRTFSSQELHTIASESGGNPMLAVDLATRPPRKSTARMRVADSRHAYGIDRYAATAVGELRRLSGSDRELVELAAIDGTQIDAKSLAPIRGCSVLDMLRTLHAIAGAGELIRSTPTGFRFGHSAFRWAVYNEIAPALRRALHTHFADGLSEADCEQYSDFERLAFHYDRSGKMDEAKRLYREAAKRAMHVQRPYTTIRLGRLGGLLDDGMSPEEFNRCIEPVISVAAALVDTGNTTELQPLLDRATSAVRAGTDERAKARLTIWCGDFAYFAKTRPLPAEDAIERAIDLLHDDSAAGRGHFVLGLRAKQRQDHEQAMHHFTEAIRVLNAMNATAHIDACRHELGTALSALGDNAGAMAAYRQAAVGARDRGRTANALIAEFCAALIAFESGNIESSHMEAMRIAEELESIGQERTAAHAQALSGQILRARGEFEAALRMIRAANEALLGGLPSHAQAMAALMRGDLQMRTGTMDEAEASLSTALKLADEIDDIALRVGAHITMAVHAFVRCDDAAASRYGDEAMGLLSDVRSAGDYKEIAWKLIEATCLGVIRAEQLTKSTIMDDLAQRDIAPKDEVLPRLASALRALSTQRADFEPGHDAEEGPLRPLENVAWGPFQYERRKLVEVMDRIRDSEIRPLAQRYMQALANPSAYDRMS